jgi:hypothetical protein
MDDIYDLLGKDLSDPEKEKIARIRALNDCLRQSGTGGTIFVTQGVQELSSVEAEQLMRKVTTYQDFKEENDPYGEHDFGSVEHNGVTYFWKIDYYDNDMMGGSEDPSDPEQTRRVLTILRADEY